MWNPGGALSFGGVGAGFSGQQRVFTESADRNCRRKPSGMDLIVLRWLNLCARVMRSCGTTTCAAALQTLLMQATKGRVGGVCCCVYRPGLLS